MHKLLIALIALSLPALVSAQETYSLSASAGNVTDLAALAANGDGDRSGHGPVRTSVAMERRRAGSRPALRALRVRFGLACLDRCG